MSPKQCFPNFSAHRSHPGCLLKMLIQIPWAQVGPGDADAAGPGAMVSEWQKPKALMTRGHPFAVGFAGS